MQIPQNKSLLMQFSLSSTVIELRLGASAKGCVDGGRGLEVPDTVKSPGNGTKMA